MLTVQLPLAINGNFSAGDMEIHWGLDGCCSKEFYSGYGAKFASSISEVKPVC